MSQQNLDSMDIFKDIDINEQIRFQNLPDVAQKLYGHLKKPDEIKKALLKMNHSDCINIVDLIKQQDHAGSINNLENIRKGSKDDQENPDSQNAKNMSENVLQFGDNNELDYVKIEDLVEYFLSKQTDPYYKSLSMVSRKVIIVALGDAFHGYTWS